MIIASEMVEMPISSERREPKTTREKRSRRLLSIPIRCWGWSAGQPSRWMQGGERRVTLSSGIVGSKGQSTAQKMAVSSRIVKIVSRLAPNVVQEAAQRLDRRRAALESIISNQDRDINSHKGLFQSNARIQVSVRHIDD